MPYLTRTESAFLVDCALRCPEIGRQVELDLFKLELRENDTIVVQNAATLPLQCWARLTHLIALSKVWLAVNGARLFVVDPPWILGVVAATLDLELRKTHDAPASVAESPRGLVCVQVCQHGGRKTDGCDP